MFLASEGNSCGWRALCTICAPPRFRHPPPCGPCTYRRDQRRKPKKGAQNIRNIGWYSAFGAFGGQWTVPQGNPLEDGPLRRQIWLAILVRGQLVHLRSGRAKYGPTASEPRGFYRWEAQSFIGPRPTATTPQRSQDHPIVGFAKREAGLLSLRAPLGRWRG